MSYRHFDGAPFLTCWSNGTHICVRDIRGNILQYKCSIGVAIEPQVIPFSGPDAVWCLRHNGVLFVGRNDSTFSGFDEDSGLLVRYGGWSFPWDRSFEIVGQCDGYPALLDMSDHRTVYVHDLSKAYVLHAPITKRAIIPLVASDILVKLPGLSIHTKGGEIDVGTAGIWVDTPQPTWGDRPLQL